MNVPEHQSLIEAIPTSNDSGIERFRAARIFKRSQVLHLNCEKKAAYICIIIGRDSVCSSSLRRLTQRSPPDPQISSRNHRFIMSSSTPLASSSPAITRDDMRAAIMALGSHLHSNTYAIVGDAACLLLGSHRATIGIDLVVPRGQTANTRSLLRAQPEGFSVDSRTLRIAYLGAPSRIEIEILTPPSLVEEFDENTPVLEIDGARVLKPVRILNARCRSLLDRDADMKKLTDAHDIFFLLKWCGDHKGSEGSMAGEVPAATKDFVMGFIEDYGGEDEWAYAGYDLEKGLRFPNF